MSNHAAPRANGPTGRIGPWLDQLTAHGALNRRVVSQSEASSSAECARVKWYSQALSPSVAGVVCVARSWEFIASTEALPYITGQKKNN